MKRNLVKLFAASCLSIFVAAAAGSAVAAETASADKGAIAKLETIKENYLASVRAEAVQTRNAVPARIATGPASSWLKRVQASEVNMATNRYERKALNEAKINGKSYFVSGAGYAENMAKNPSTCSARDPYTNNMVDKSQAAIYADASGKVYYFESENSFKGFIALATPATVYGYSEAQ